MFFPIKDENPTRRFAWMTLTLILTNVAFFVWQLTSAAPGQLVLDWGFVPVAHGGDRIAALFTSMFLHGGLLHLGSNMLYLWIFGNNIEDTLGPFTFLAFYLGSGLLGHLGHGLSDPSSALPTIGASGAVAGVLAAYLLRFPRANVFCALVLFVIIRVVRVPAALVIGIWGVMQVVNGAIAVAGGPDGGVAWFEHIGGFVGGLGIFWLLQRMTR